jgi:hypothetical protein
VCVYNKEMSLIFSAYSYYFFCFCLLAWFLDIGWRFYCCLFCENSTFFTLLALLHLYMFDPFLHWTSSILNGFCHITLLHFHQNYSQLDSIAKNRNQKNTVYFVISNSDNVMRLCAFLISSFAGANKNKNWKINRRS